MDKEYIITEKWINGELNYYINDTLIDNSIFEDELSEYKIILRTELIDDLINWISESKSENDTLLMKNDLKYLMDKKDKYIFSSIYTNKYILKSDDEFNFNVVCNDLILFSIDFKNDLNKYLVEIKYKLNEYKDKLGFENLESETKKDFYSIIDKINLVKDNL